MVSQEGLVDVPLYELADISVADVRQRLVRDYVALDVHVGELLQRRQELGAHLVAVLDVLQALLHDRGAAHGERGGHLEEQRVVGALLVRERLGHPGVGIHVSLEESCRKLGAVRAGQEVLRDGDDAAGVVRHDFVGPHDHPAGPGDNRGRDVGLPRDVGVGLVRCEPPVHQAGGHRDVSDAAFSRIPVHVEGRGDARQHYRGRDHYGKNDHLPFHDYPLRGTSAPAPY